MVDINPMSIITLNINGLNAPNISRQVDQNQDPATYCL